MQITQGVGGIEALEQSLTDLLIKSNDSLINVALNLSPSYEVSKLILASLNKVINAQSTLAEVFAIPVILVAGSKKKLALPTELDSNELNQLIGQDERLATNDYYISGKLFDPTVLSKISPSQLYYWNRNIAQAKLFLPVNLELMPLNVINESVILRFLIGVNCSSDKSIYNLDAKAFAPIAMKLMKFISTTLAKPELTLFPIPLYPIPLSNALNIAHEYRKEIAISVALSNVVKSIRSQGCDPIATLSANNNIITINVYATNSQTNETSLWHLSPFEDFTAIVAKLTQLLDEMQVPWQI